MSLHGGLEPAVQERDDEDAREPEEWPSRWAVGMDWPSHRKGLIMVRFDFCCTVTMILEGLEFVGESVKQRGSYGSQRARMGVNIRRISRFIVACAVVFFTSECWWRY